jgi:hypothetical protein
MSVIALAISDAEIAACFPVLAQLRPHLIQADFLTRVRRQQDAGYQLAALQADGAATASISRAAWTSLATTLL